MLQNHVEKRSNALKSEFGNENFKTILTVSAGKLLNVTFYQNVHFDEKTKFSIF